ncbi:MAG: signal peptide peptidase SppA [Planctomycetota bacterium]|nr:signal peptide peptidase SppA [Planctomycetota bacterium]
MRRFIISTCVLCLCASIAFANGPGKAGEPKTDAKPQTETWAKIELSGSYPEGPQAPGLFGELVSGLSGTLERFDRAAADEKIVGVLLRLNNPSVGWAKVNELQLAIKRVRAAGKPVVAVMDMATTIDYLLACSCDKIIMPESGAVMMVGVRAEVSFYKNLLDKLNIKADFLHVGEYKSAAEPYTRTEMSPEFREQLGELLDDYYAIITKSVIAARKLSAKQVETIIDSGPHTATAAKKLGLIDHVAYDDEVGGLIRTDANKQVVFVKKYGKKKLDTDFSGLAGMMKMMNLLMGVEPRTAKNTKPKIAVIYAVGMIMPGKSAESPFTGAKVMGSDTIVAAVNKAAADETVKAIVLRVNSPGGSALASDLIWRSLQKSGKPIVASMGDTAASGGYYISMGADVIYAEPGTLTGSIGVVGGKLAMKGLFNKIGITSSVIARGKNSGLLSSNSPFSDTEKLAMNKMLDEIYGQFTHKAAAGRKMEYEKLEKMARGRIYSGTRAKGLGLVDEIGTLDQAVAHAKKLAGLKADDETERLLLPHPSSPFEALFGPIEARVNSTSALAGQAKASALKQALLATHPAAAQHLEALTIIELLAKEPRLTLMPFQLKIQ